MSILSVKKISLEAYVTHSIHMTNGMCMLVCVCVCVCVCGKKVREIVRETTSIRCSNFQQQRAGDCVNSTFLLCPAHEEQLENVL